MLYSVVLSESLNDFLLNHLIREDGQEDLCFGLYNKSTGTERISGVIKELILPIEGDRNVHGNVSFNPQYFDRVASIALEQESGICFLHSHPGPGWQGMSTDDVETEKMLSSRVKATTGLPLIGLTTGSDGTWSARYWNKTGPKQYAREWCSSVRVVGDSFKVYYNDRILPPLKFGTELSRTISSWGEKKQNEIARLKIGIVGMGSVGSIVAESLLRTGVVNITMIDFDIIETKNLDRLQGIGLDDVGKLKVDAFKARLESLKLYENQSIEAIPFSITEETGLKSALDCDILFSCVDRPLPRFVLDIIAYAHHIPVIDGGIDAKYSVKKRNLELARWKTHLVGMDRVCMKCLGQYTPEDVALELNGDLDDPIYIKGLPPEHFINRGENVYAFSIGAASMEVHQMLSFVLKTKGITYGPKEYDFSTGTIDSDFRETCFVGCDISEQKGLGDKINDLIISNHNVAAENRKNRFIADDQVYEKVELKTQRWLGKFIRRFFR